MDFISNWGDVNFIGVNKIKLFSSDNEEIKLSD